MEINFFSSYISTYNVALILPLGSQSLKYLALYRKSLLTSQPHLRPLMLQPYRTTLQLPNVIFFFLSLGSLHMLCYHPRMLFQFLPTFHWLTSYCPSGLSLDITFFSEVFIDTPKQCEIAVSLMNFQASCTSLH